MYSEKISDTFYKIFILFQSRRKYAFFEKSVRYTDFRLLHAIRTSLLPSVSVSNKINQYLSEKGTINDKLGIPGLFSVDYALKDLVTQIGQTESNRVEMSGLADTLIRLSGKTYPAKCI